MIAQIILDIAIVGLLSTTVVYCTILSKKINHLRQGKKDMDVFLGEFNNAVLKAEDNIGALKEIGEETDAKLRSRIEKARILTNDLSFLTDKGEILADNLESQITASRASARVPKKKTVRNVAGASENSVLERFARGSSAGHRKNSGNSLPITTLKKNAAKNSVQREKEIGNREAVEAKKRALEEVLKQIAAKKEEANRPSLANTRRHKKRAETHTNPIPREKSRVGNRKLTPEKASLLSERKLAELLKAARQ